MRKGSCTANARLQSFEKGMFFCKLTVGFLQLNRQSSVSLGLCELLPQHVYKTPFIFSLPCMSQNSHPFSQTKHFPFKQTILLPSKATLFSQTERHPFEQTFFYFPPTQPFSATNTANSHPAITYCPQRTRLFF